MGVPNSELARLGLEFGGDGKEPMHKAVAVLNKVTEQRLDMLKAEEFLHDHFKSMSSACQRNLTHPSRFIVDKILQIEDGELRFVEVGGAKVDLSLPKYQIIQNAAAKLGYSVTQDGSLKVPKGSPITFAIRQADFGSTFSRMEIEIKGTSELNSMLLESGQALPY